MCSLAYLCVLPQVNVKLRLPAVLNKFLHPISISAEEFFPQWRSLTGPPLKLQEVVCILHFCIPFKLFGESCIFANLVIVNLSLEYSSCKFIASIVLTNFSDHAVYRLTLLVDFAG